MWRAGLRLSLVALLLPACAAVQAKRDLDDFVAQFPLKRAALAAAQERLTAMCREEQDSCRVRWMRTSNTSRSAWEQRLLPPYRVIVDVWEDEARKRVQLRLVDEYALGVSRMVASQVDSGQLGEEEGRLIIDRTFAQAEDALRREFSYLHRTYLLAQQRDQGTIEAFAAFVIGTAAVALNGYAASLPAQVRVPSTPAPAVPRGYVPVPHISASTVQCTYRLNALAGMMLCVNSDGTVVAR